ncbi:B3 domain-containing protein Os06g0194400-like [Phragmites australis]|uniref:B3 domain-containing protein Os06g0194400-like n=1 Tax=Phragmites australis TaxID=29695 RepID=UPI002D79B969|nr:B3 domain-containing protein Os06g0194400-like [Phragmites australis]
MADAASYEEQRRRQVEANKRKLEELQLHHLSAAVREAAANPSPAKSSKRKARAPRDATGGDATPLRRSGRVANLPEQPKYREVVPDFERKVRRTYGTGRRDLANRVYATDEERSYAISKAEELEDELGSGHPIFVKPMTQSHVTGGFWLGLPTQFCRKYLPKRDETITLVDEEDDESDTLYLAQKAGLSAGWRGFAIHHKLVDGDCLVFQLIERTKFMVYIIRASSYYENED